MWSVLISTELVANIELRWSCAGYKSPVSWDREHQQLARAPRSSTRNPSLPNPLDQIVVSHQRGESKSCERVIKIF